MNHYETNMLKRRAAARAWNQEKLLICNGKGTRDWHGTQQQKILKYSRLAGYVAQFVVGFTAEDCQIQFLNFPLEYSSAHEKECRNRRFGLFDTEEFEPMSMKPEGMVVNLTIPNYLGYMETRHDLFAGMKNKFGISYSAENSDPGVNRQRFGLATTPTNENDTADTNKRKNKYGF